MSSVNQVDWDNYMGLSWRAVYDFIRDQPIDADAAEIEERTVNDKNSYSGMAAIA